MLLPVGVEPGRRPTGKMTTFELPAERKRKPRVYGLRTFADPGCPADFHGAFRDNIRAFLRDCAEIEDHGLRGMPVWCTQLVDEMTGAVIPLYAVEECVRHSPHPLCDPCRCAGWSHHLVSKRRYHLIIPSDDDWDRETLRPDAFDLQSHLLHGIVHCNGFGHLLCINGRDGGSHFVCGRHTMDLWDRLCTALRVREVTVDDSSRKKSMDLRLLLGVAHGVTWFGRWGYTFRVGSFGVTQEEYKKSVELIGSLDLDGLIVEESKKMGREGEQLQRIVFTYRRMAEFDSSGPHHLATLRDLLRFLLDFKNRKVVLPPPEKKARNPSSPVPFPVAGVSLVPLVVPAQRARATTIPATGQSRRRCRDFEAMAAELDSRWPVKRLHVAAQVVVDALEQRPGGMSRQELRDAARLVIGDTGLLDFVLKSIGNCVVGTRVVRRTRNPATRILEFSLDDLCGGAGVGGHGDADPATPSRRVATALPTFVVAVATQREPPTIFSTRISHPSPSQVERDTAWVYKHLLLGSRPAAAEAVRQSKRWVKVWSLRDEDDDRLRFLCSWMPSKAELAGGHLTRPLPPPEVVVLPPHATVGDLREEAERALRDTYCVMEAFRASAVEGVSGEEWEPLFGCGAESGARVWVVGSGADLVGAGVGGEERLLYEGGAENWMVSCGCGARDDDGERMVACDMCEVWQHTRCVGIADGDAVPALFLCGACARAVMRHMMTKTAEDGLVRI